MRTIFQSSPEALVKRTLLGNLKDRQLVSTKHGKNLKPLITKKDFTLTQFETLSSDNTHTHTHYE